MKPLTLTRTLPDGTREEVEAAKLWERAERAEARLETERACRDEEARLRKRAEARVAELERDLNGQEARWAEEHNIADIAQATVVRQGARIEELEEQRTTNAAVNDAMRARIEALEGALEDIRLYGITTEPEAMWMRARARAALAGQMGEG